MTAEQCILFHLPSGAGGLASSMCRGFILAKIKKFCATHSIDFKVKLHSYILYIWFEKDSDYTLFFINYNFEQGKEWRRPELVHRKYEE